MPDDSDEDNVRDVLEDGVHTRMEVDEIPNARGMKSRVSKREISELQSEEEEEEIASAPDQATSGEEEEQIEEKPDSQYPISSRQPPTPDEEDSDPPFRPPKLDKGKGRAPPLPSTPPRSSPSYTRFGRVLSDQPESRSSKSREMGMYSDDPILLGSPESSSSSLPISRRKKGRPPVVGRGGRKVLVVELNLMRIEELRKYDHEFPLRKPSEGSRRRALLRQTHHVEKESEDEDDVLFRAIRGKRKREIRETRGERKGPVWKVASSRSETGTSEDFGGYGLEQEDEDENGDEEVGDDEESGDDGSESDFAVRRSVRVGKREFKKSGRISTRGTRRKPPKPIDQNSFYGNNPARPSKTSTARSRAINLVSDVEHSQSGSDFEMKSQQDDEGEESEVDELDSESYEEHSESSGRSKGKKKQKGKDSAEVLTRHRPFCEKCSREPASTMLEKALARKKRPGKRKKRDDDEISDEELSRSLGGWLECEKCVVSSHWDCLGDQQQKGVLAVLAHIEGSPPDGQKKRRNVDIDESTTFKCSRCSDKVECLVCHSDVIVTPNEQVNGSDTKPILNGNGNGKAREPAPFLFRCTRCKQGCHYVHLRDPLGETRHSLADIGAHYQNPTRKGRDGWQCHQCRDFVWTVDIVVAWRPSPADAVEDEREEEEKPRWKDDLPREYLVKWTARGFRHVTWVPHAWMRACSAMKLRNFIDKGPALDLITDATLAAKGDDIAEPTIAKVMAEDDKIHGREGRTHHDRFAALWEGHGPPPDKDANSSIPVEWSTVDRVLDVMLLAPRVEKKAKNGTKRGKRILSVSDTSARASEHVEEQSKRPDGLEPPLEDRMNIDEWEDKAGRVLLEDEVDEVANLVTWCFVKWDDLQHDQSTWDTPPPRDSPLYPAFKHALKRYLRARQVQIPVLTKSECKLRDVKAELKYTPPQEQPDFVVGGKLMPFQMQGLQWLLTKHFRRQSCILADDMGLGKTIQIASVLGCLSSAEHQIYPHLVIVPNSTITNWVREFEKWVPHIRVVPYYGEAASRKIISQYELYHKGMKGQAAGLKAHVVLTTYDQITGADFRVFGGIPRWEVLCVDEGQRLKFDGSLIFNRLKTLNSVHRILMTGTPLNNNLRELFNLLNFLDPAEFSNLVDLENKFANLNEALVQQLHEMIAPYILRRIKADVLKLPPKIEIIVPISLAPLQKQVYKGVLERNADVLKAITDARRKKARRTIVNTGA